MNFYDADKVEIMFSESDIQARLAALGAQITVDYKDTQAPLVLIGVLKGSFLFMADLCRYIDLPIEVDFLGLSSYGDQQESSGVVRVTQDLSRSIEGKHVLVIEDIIDSGLTLSYLVDLFKYRKANSIKIVTLLDKPTGRKVDLKADYIGFEVPDAFVVGYGLDYAEKYRNLPYIGILKPAVYSGEEE